MSFKGDFFAGRFHLPQKATGQFKDFSPADLSDQILTVQFTHDHIDPAVESARKAYTSWSRLKQEERNQTLLRLKEVFEIRKPQMAEAISRDTGKPLWEGLQEAQNLANKIDITLKESLRLVSEEHIPNALPGVEGVIRFRPRGVMVVLGPFNFPAHLPNGHIVPALAMGNTVVFKPSEQTPFVGQMLAECFEAAQLPEGVFNLVHGDGETGRKLVIHEHIDGVLFTGSYEVGQKIKQETLHHYWKILALEMGGKNATIVWDDAKLEKALADTLTGAFLTTGQRCSGTSRLIVHDRIADQFVEKFYQAAKKIKIGHWREPVFMGPLINESAVEKYIRFQEIANREGNESLMRGKVLELKQKGYYVTPSLHAVKKFDPQSIYQKSEIFGPNVAIYRTSDFQHAMDIVNSTGFGLSMALFSQSRELYEESILSAKVGLLNWNRTTNGASSRLPFGGLGKSGNDRPSAHFAVQYCSVPLASLEDPTDLNPKSLPIGLSLE
ncbi:MAG: succinylglutamate-semialdehyde dehydrogenase [Bdellovibrio sp.]